jgi:hypothetical protein
MKLTIFAATGGIGRQLLERPETIKQSIGIAN